VVIDTSSEFFIGEEENNQTDVMNHVKWLRSISERLPGKPTVLTLCHPTKNADPNNPDQMLPRGGGSFANAIDGILVCAKKGNFTLLSRHPEKYRDGVFTPIPFRRYERFVVNGKGEKIRTIIARVASEVEAAANEYQLSAEEMRLLAVLASDPTLSYSDVAKKVMWLLKNGDPDKKKVQRVRGRLLAAGFIDRNGVPTEEGQRRLQEHSENVVPFPTQT
jgi:hypothetical protein